MRSWGLFWNMFWFHSVRGMKLALKPIYTIYIQTKPMCLWRFAIQELRLTLWRNLAVDLWDGSAATSLYLGEVDLFSSEHALPGRLHSHRPRLTIRGEIMNIFAYKSNTLEIHEKWFCMTLEYFMKRRKRYTRNFFSSCKIITDCFYSLKKHTWSKTMERRKDARTLSNLIA